MSQQYWNPEEELGQSYRDQLIYSDAYYNWTENKKYVHNAQFPTNQLQYPRMRDEMQFFHRERDAYKPSELSSNGAAKIYKSFNNTRSQDINYMRHVYPPTYYEMWG